MAETAFAVTETHRHIMRHALGLNRHPPVERNYFVTGEGAADFDAWRELVAAGLATEKRYALSIQDSVFHVTDAGRAALEQADG